MVKMYKLVNPITGETYMCGTMGECMEHINDPSFPFAHVVESQIQPKHLASGSWSDGNGTYGNWSK